MHGGHENEENKGELTSHGHAHTTSTQADSRIDRHKSKKVASAMTQHEVCVHFCHPATLPAPNSTPRGRVWKPRPEEPRYQLHRLHPSRARRGEVPAVRACLAGSSAGSAAGTTYTEPAAQYTHTQTMTLDIPRLRFRAIFAFDLHKRAYLSIGAKYKLRIGGGSVEAPPIGESFVCGGR